MILAHVIARALLVRVWMDRAVACALSVRVSMDRAAATASGRRLFLERVTRRRAVRCTSITRFIHTTYREIRKPF